MKLSIKMVEGVPGKWFATIRVEQPMVGGASPGLRRKIANMRKAGWVVEKGRVGKYGAYWRFNAPYGMTAEKALEVFNG